MHLYTTTVPTPVGPFTLLVEGDGVCAAGFTDRPGTLPRRPTPRRSVRARRAPPRPRLPPRRRPATLRPAPDPGQGASRLRAYLAGEVGALDDVVVAQPGDPAEQAAWAALRTIPAGQTISYRQLGGLADLADPAPHPLGRPARRPRVARH